MKRDFKLPVFRKKIKDFLLSEEGKITKKDIIKIGTSLAFLAMMFTPTQAIAQAQHTNYFFTEGRGGHHSHASHASHGSHSAHSSHCNSKFCW